MEEHRTEMGLEYDGDRTLRVRDADGNWFHVLPTSQTGGAERESITWNWETRDRNYRVQFQFRGKAGLPTVDLNTATGYMQASLRRRIHDEAFRETFTTPFDQHAEREGEPFTVVRAVTEPDGDHDTDVLPMYVIRFADGVEIEAWPEEVK